MKKRFTYKKAGVDIARAEKSLSKIKDSIRGTHNSQVLKPIGAFGGFYELPSGEFKNPVLVASTDGVGTKLKVSVMMKQHNTVGQDLVNHCINDIAVCGAKPLFFLDYFACGKLKHPVYEQVIQGFVTACKKAQLPLIGGETAEMPDLYHPDDYDLAGTIVGIVEKDRIIDGQDIEAGDALIGVASNGLHTNGYSLARKVLFSKYKPDDFVEEIGNSVGKELLKIHLNYFPLIEKARLSLPVKGIAHITGGGLFKNTMRLMPPGLVPDFDWNSWKIPPLFALIRRTGNVPEADMRETFNLGIGLVFVIDPKSEPGLLSFSKDFGLPFYRIGKVAKQ